MNISKNGKRIMALLMTFAMVAVSVAVAPKTAKAAGETPTVKILGATLRLDGGEGTQSMRIGIEVTNADAAKDCGIRLTVGGKQIEVSTKNADYQKIYDKDEAAKKIVYTAVVTGIPVANFDTEISAVGFTTPTDGEEAATPSESKTVNGIVETMNSNYGENYYLENGILYNKITAEDLNNETLPSYYNDYVTNPGWISCSSFSLVDNGHTGKAIQLETSYGYGGLPIVPSLPTVGTYKISCYAKSAAGADEAPPSIRFRAATKYTAIDNKTLTLSDDWQQLSATYELKEIEALDNNNNNNAKIIISPTSDVKSTYIIDDISVVKKVSADDIPNGKLVRDTNVKLTSENVYASASLDGTTTYNNDGSITFSPKKEYGGGGIAFYLDAKHFPVSISNYKKLRIVLSSSTASAPLCITLRTDKTPGFYNGTDCLTKYPNLSATADEDTTFECDLTDGSLSTAKPYAVLIKYNPPTDNPPEKITITIKSISLTV